MVNRKDYNNDLFKQVQELISKCDNLSHEMKKERKEHQKEKKELTDRIEKLEKENHKLRDDNDRLKKIINNNSDNSSKPPSTDIKKNIPNNREKSGNKRGGQKGHKGNGLRKEDIEIKIANNEIEHEIINVSNGTIVNFVKELGKKTEGIVEKIKEELLNSKLMYTDGTSGRCNNKNICIRNYSTEKNTYLAATIGKSKKCIEEIGILPKYMMK